MNIYFACSITGGRQDEIIYQALVVTMQEAGHQVPTAILASPEVMPLEGMATPADVYARDTAWIEECDLLVAEVSTPSHGVGYEVGYALSLGKRVLCLYRKDCKVSKMILGNPHPHLTTHSYKTSKEAVQLLSQFLDRNSMGELNE